MKRKPSPAVAISLAALFFSLSGAGFAASRYVITSKSQIAPKVRHTLKGERGPAGIAGAQGPQGPTGQAGAVTVSDKAGPFVVVQPGGATVASVTCPAGTVAVGGGYYKDPGIEIINSAPTPDPQGWEIIAANNNTKDAQFLARVTCVTGSFNPN